LDRQLLAKGRAVSFRRERDLTAAKYARWAGEHKYDFNMQVSARDMTRKNRRYGKKMWRWIPPLSA
jgi:hypothetical protein